jgi:hypothetical protein
VRTKLLQVKDYAEDDWTGVSDVQERRKRQNRLSKRAQRQYSMGVVSEIGLKLFTKAVSSRKSAANERRLLEHTPGGLPSLSIIKSSNSPPAKNSPSISAHFRIWFPLSSDHRLTLIQFNLYRAIWINLALVTPAAVKSVDYISEMSIFPRQGLPSHMPSTLTPTILQRQIRHLAYIDAAPLATLRDNLIMASGTYDEEELCLDLFGGLFYSDDGREHIGVMVWADPWNVAGWEMTEGFVRKWRFLLKGCPEIFDATNYWRRMRQEDPLVVDVGTSSLP